MSHREIELSTSPRSTWIWAANAAQAAELTAILEAAGCHPMPANGLNAGARVLDIEVGAESLDAVLALRDAGYTYRWHGQQAVANRTQDIFGVPVTG